MKLKFLILVVPAFTFSFIAAAQTNKTDSLQLAKTLHELLSICRRVDFTDPKVRELGTFYKAAPYIVYRGDDKNRAWKVFADYSNADEKKGVDEVCERINRTANQDSSGYKIVKYFTEKESEGTWHVLMVTYKKKAVEKKVAYAFLKIGNKFGLGDID
jgi:hypothetical protein